MKVGDLVAMTDEDHYNPEFARSIGIIIDDNTQFPGGKERIGVMWSDSNCVDFEPKVWLEVISESR